MKKIVFFLSIVFLSFTSQAISLDTLAQKAGAVIDSTKQSVINTANQVDTSRLSKQVYADFKQALAGIAAALKVGVEHVYIVLVRQQIVKAITLLLTAMVLILVPLIWMGKLWRSWNEASGDGAFALGALATISVIGPMIGGFVVLIGSASTIVTGFVNPEYGAMLDIMDFIQKIRH